MVVPHRARHAARQHPLQRAGEEQPRSLPLLPSKRLRQLERAGIVEHVGCTYDPGFGVDAIVRADLTTMYQVWLGRVDLQAALRSGLVAIDGSTTVVRRLPQALSLSPVAAMVAAVTG